MKELLYKKSEAVAALNRVDGFHPMELARKVFEALREHGIAVNVHYIPVYLHPYYQEHGYKDVHCRNAEEVYSHIISLPLYPTLTEEQQQYVIETLKYVING